MRALLERVVDTVWYNLGWVPEKEFYIDDHVERGACTVVERLVRANPALTRYRDVFGRPLLHLAVNEGHCAMSSLLLRLGCNVNAVDAEGATALHHAVDVGSLELVVLLVYHGASPEIADKNGDAPLDLAEDSRKEMIRRVFELRGQSALSNG